MNLPAARFRFDEPFFGTALGVDAPPIAAGAPVGEPHVKFGTQGSRLVGLATSPEHDAPSGIYNVEFGDGMLTFSDVHAPSTATLEAANTYAVPLLRIRPTVEGCVNDCDIASVDVSWARSSAFAWEGTDAPNQARLVIVADLHGEQVALTADVSSVGSIAWQDMPVKGSGIIDRELAHISTSRLCYLAVTYRSELGMTMTSQLANPACNTAQ
jgi:hypothetical protein